MQYARIPFSKLPVAQQRALFDEAATWWGQVFNTPASDLEAYWFENKSKETILYTLRDDDGLLLGTVTVKYYHVSYRGRNVVICKMGMAMVSEARGNAFGARCIANQALHHALQYPFDEVYVFSTMIHPVTYRICTRFLERYYPHYEGPQDPELSELAAYLSEYFALDKPETAHPFVFRERRASIEPDEVRAYWQQKSDPAVRFFLDACPNYDKGECLIFLAPIRSSFVLTALRKYAGQWLDRRLRGRRRVPPDPRASRAASSARRP